MSERPKADLRDPEYIAFATLFNDLTHAPLPADPNGERGYVRFSHRQALADYLWSLGYRRADS